MKTSLILILVVLASQIRAFGQVEPVYSVKMIKPRVTSELSYEDAYVRIDFLVLSQILFKLHNKTQTPIEIDWVHASFVDTGAEAHRIVHEAIRYIERDKAPPPTVVPAGANIKDTIIPSDYVSYESGSAGGWKVQSIFEGRLAEYEGKTISILLPIKMRGVVKNYQFAFKVEKDLIATAKRDKEMEIARARQVKEREIRSDELLFSVLTKKEFGDKWPFIMDQATLACGRQAVFLIVNGTAYALNGIASGMMVDGKPALNDLRELQIDKAADILTFSTSLRFMGLKLCK